MTTITIDRATVEQALEALESVYGDSCDALHALRAALAQEQAVQTWICPDSDVHRYAKPGHCEDCGKTLVPVQAEPFTPDAIAHTQAAWKMGYEARKAEEAEPVQEPWATRERFYDAVDRAVENVRQEMKVKTVNMRLPEYDIAMPIIDAYSGHVLVGPVVPAPPQREPLTEEEIDRIRAAEREACAKRLEAIGCDHCAANIRARGKEC